MEITFLICELHSYSLEGEIWPHAIILYSCLYYLIIIMYYKNTYVKKGFQLTNLLYYENQRDEINYSSAFQNTQLESIQSSSFKRSIAAYWYALLYRLS